jgi:hypothetical protein
MSTIRIIINIIGVAITLVLMNNTEKLQFYGQEGALGCLLLILVIGLISDFIES